MTFRVTTAPSLQVASSTCARRGRQGGTPLHCARSKHYSLAWAYESDLFASNHPKAWPLAALHSHAAGAAMPQLLTTHPVRPPPARAQNDPHHPNEASQAPFRVIFRREPLCMASSPSPALAPCHATLMPAHSLPLTRTHSLTPTHTHCTPCTPRRRHTEQLLGALHLVWRAAPPLPQRPAALHSHPCSLRPCPSRRRHPEQLPGARHLVWRAGRQGTGQHGVHAVWAGRGYCADA